MYDRELHDDLLNTFCLRGCYFKFQMTQPKDTDVEYSDYFVVMAKTGYELFHLTKTLTIHERDNLMMSLHSGIGALKHAVLMYLYNSNEGRSS